MKTSGERLARRGGRRLMKRLALALAIGVLLLRSAAADTLKSKKTDETIRGKVMSGTTTDKEGRVCHIITLENGKCKPLPIDEWILVEQDPPPKASEVEKQPDVPPEAGYVRVDGKWKSKDWFDEMYAKHGERLTLADKKYIDLGKPGGIKMIANGRVESTASALVTRILGPQEALLSVGERMIHVKGLDTGKLADGDLIDDLRIVRGRSFPHEDRTLPGFEACKPLTKEQFKDALSNGYIPPDEQGGSMLPGGKNVPGPKEPHPRPPVAKWIECPKCKGVGKINVTRTRWYWIEYPRMQQSEEYTVKRDCPKCEGFRKVINPMYEPPLSE